MRTKQSESKPATRVVDPRPKDNSMQEIWDQAAQEFEQICGKSLQNGEVKSFDDVQRAIEESGKASYRAEPEDKWDKAKSVGLLSLKYLKVLVGAASQASSFIPIPSAATSIASSALCYVFDIPEAIKGYNDAINSVFEEVSSTLAQFQVYTSMDHIDQLLVRQIHSVMVSFVKICAHVVKYRQSRKRDRFLQHAKSILTEDSDLDNEMKTFRAQLQKQRDVEGTVTLAMLFETHQDVAQLLEQSASLNRTTEKTQKDVQSLKEDADRVDTLVRIRDTLGVQSTVQLDTKTTQTCSDFYAKCSQGSGEWIWTHKAYTDWTATAVVSPTTSTKDENDSRSHVLILSGPPSSGKTLACASITKRLEGYTKERTSVAHYFFPASAKKSDEDKNPVQTALKYMAFQIARVDPTVRKALGKACQAGAGEFRGSEKASLEDLWEKLRIGVPGSGAMYYLTFDGLENLPDKQLRILLDLVFGNKMAASSARVRLLVSGTDSTFEKEPGKPIAKLKGAGRIRMDENNQPDMVISIEEKLNARRILQNVKPGSEQERARQKLLDKLPRKVKGSYSLLNVWLDEAIRLLSTRRAIRELDSLLDKSMSSHDVALKNLEKSLTAEDINELNELLKWVLFGNDLMSLDALEAAMFLYSETESLATLQYIIKEKYLAVLKLDEGYVFAQDGVEEYLQKEKKALDKSSQAKDRATVSMTITINRMDEEHCRHFLWDLAHKGIRDNFKFDFDTPSTTQHGSHSAIAVSEFEAQHTLVRRSFQYLNSEPSDNTKDIGPYIVCWLPHHLGRLRQLEDEMQGLLMPEEKYEIGENLYQLFRSPDIIQRHKRDFEREGGLWWADEMAEFQKWFEDPVVVRKLDKKWRDSVQKTRNPMKGYLKHLVRMVVEGFLRGRDWNVQNAIYWISEFIDADDRELRPSSDANRGPDASSSTNTSADGSASDDSSSDMNWDRLSTWCQKLLELSDSDLDSLWYERLAEAATLCGNADAALSFYKSALEKKNPHWTCHRGFGEALHAQDQCPKAITQLYIALNKATSEHDQSKPDERDIVELRLRLGEYESEAGDMQKAVEHYLVACKSPDPELARKGELGHLKTILKSTDADKAKKALQRLLMTGDWEADRATSMVRILKMLARGDDHDFMVSRIFTVARADPNLLRAFVRAMETATKASQLVENLVSDDRFAEDEACGVLLYYRGVAAYMYQTPPEDSEPTSAAVKLWHRCNDRLADIGGSNALFVRNEANYQLAKHYFQSMVDGGHLRHVNDLEKLDKGDSSNSSLGTDSSGFLGALYALQKEEVKAKAHLSGRIRYALQVLSDDNFDNDVYGFSAIARASAQCHDFKNQTVALSLTGPPDLVTDTLYNFKAESLGISTADEKQPLLDAMAKLADEIVIHVKSRVPDISQQRQRVAAAKEYIQAALATIEGDENTDGSDQRQVGIIDPQSGHEGHSQKPSHLTGVAYRFLESLLADTLKTHNFEEPLWSPWDCDGRKADGTPCRKDYDMESEFYTCIFCGRMDFCGDCLSRLRDSNADEGIMACSAKHCWLKYPPLGSDFYVGVKAKRVCVLNTIEASKSDDRILEVVMAQSKEKGEMLVEEWYKTLAEEWGMAGIAG